MSQKKLQTQKKRANCASILVSVLTGCWAVVHQFLAFYAYFPRFQANFRRFRLFCARQKVVGAKIYVFFYVVSIGAQFIYIILCMHVKEAEISLKQRTHLGIGMQCY